MDKFIRIHFLIFLKVRADSSSQHFGLKIGLSMRFASWILGVD